MVERISVIKIGGNVVDTPDALSSFLRDFRMLAGPKILVHGGGKEATGMCRKLGIETRMIDGRRLTGADTLEVVTMVYAGLINKRIVAQLQSLGIDALGLTGADANLITATRRSPKPVDYGFVGDIDPLDVNDCALSGMLREGYTPVICSITHDGHGQLLNSNADTVAMTVAAAASRIAPVDLIYCFEKAGVLADSSDDSSVVPLITPEIFETMCLTKVVSDGMVPKLTNAFRALRNGVRTVTIKNAGNLLAASGTVVALER